VDRFLRFAVRFRFVFFAFRFFGHVIAPDVIQPSSEYSQQTKGAIGAASFEHAALLVDAEFHPALEHPHELLE
jgi:hypothetical protein